MTPTAQAELLTRLRIQRRARLARRGDLGLLIAALYLTADCMDAWDRKMDGYSWVYWKQWKANKRQGQPRSRPTRQPGYRWGRDIVEYLHHTSAGAASLDAMGAEMDRRRALDRVAYRKWLRATGDVYDEMLRLIWPKGGPDPNVSSDDVRAIADRLMVEAMPLPA